MRRPDHSRIRLRLPRIEAKPKRVRLEGWRDHAEIGKDPGLRAQLDEIIESIGRGEGVPEEYYRAGIDQDRDELLQQRGIMHLHQGGRNSDTLLFLVQYADTVLLLESNSHVHFRTNPQGKNIAALVQAWFLNLEREIAEATQAARNAAEEAERQAAEKQRAKLAASLAKLKRQAGKTWHGATTSRSAANLPRTRQSTSSHRAKQVQTNIPQDRDMLNRSQTPPGVVRCPADRHPGCMK